LPPPNRNEINRLTLGITRALHRRASLRVLLAAADADIAGRKTELRSARARLTRASSKAPALPHRTPSRRS